MRAFSVGLLSSAESSDMFLASVEEPRNCLIGCTSVISRGHEDTDGMALQYYKITRLSTPSTKHKGVATIPYPYRRVNTLRSCPEPYLRVPWTDETSLREYTICYCCVLVTTNDLPYRSQVRRNAFLCTLLGGCVGLREQPLLLGQTIRGVGSSTPLPLSVDRHLNEAGTNHLLPAS